MQGMTEAEYLGHKAELKRLQTGAKQFRDKNRIFAQYMTEHEIDYWTWRDAKRGIFRDKIVYDYDKKLLRMLADQGRPIPGEIDADGRHVRYWAPEGSTSEGRENHKKEARHA